MIYAFPGPPLIFVDPGLSQGIIRVWTASHPKGGRGMLKPDRMPTPRAYLQYVVDHPFRIFALILFITLVFAWRLPALRFQTSIYDLAIEDLPEAAQYQRFKEEFGCEEIILVVARTQNILVSFKSVYMVS
jgi:hypothetical protein